jgi:phosphoribosylanthranilate isomerase
MSVRVKICGITRVEDALGAAAAGADALGFNLWPGSRRHLPVQAVRAIVARLPPFVTPVGLFVDQPPDEVARLAAAAGVAAIQLHGDEPPEQCRGHALPVLKAFRVAGPADLLPIARYLEAGISAVLLDGSAEGFGGTGQRFDWALAGQVPGGRPLVLAGGLTPANVAEAVRAVRPWAVDVASGVESSPGVKDADKVARFVRAAKETLQ